MKNQIVHIVLALCMPIATAFASSYEEKPLADCGQFQLIAITIGSFTPGRQITTSTSHVLRFTNWRMDIPLVMKDFFDSTSWKIAPGTVSFPVEVAVFRVRTGRGGLTWEADLPTMSPHSSPVYSRIVCKEL